MDKNEIKIGDKFGCRTVASELYYDTGYYWCVDCKCKCGKISKCRINRLLNGESKSCRNCNDTRKIPKEIKGDKLYLLTLLEDPFFMEECSSPKWHVRVRCICGWEGVVKLYNLQKGFKQSCGSCAKKGENHYGFTGYKSISGTYWTSVIRAAKIRNISFEILIQNAWELLEFQQNKCALTGWEIKTNSTASIDRIDSTKPYIDGNIQWTHKDVNISKWEFSQEWYRTLCWLVVNYNSLVLPEIEIEVRNRAKTFKGSGNLSGGHWYRIGRCASKRCEIEFALTIHEAWDLYVKQKGRCALSGLPIYFDIGGVYDKNNRNEWEGTASLDRIDSNKGYTINNVQWVHKDINKMKFDFTEEYFKSICKSVCQTTFVPPNLNYLLEPKSVVKEKVKANHSLPRGESGYKGVVWDNERKKWGVALFKDKKRYYVGRFDDKEEAAHKYDEKVLELYGENKCYLNFGPTQTKVN